MVQLAAPAVHLARGDRQHDLALLGGDYGGRGLRLTRAGLLLDGVLLLRRHQSLHGRVSQSVANFDTFNACMLEKERKT